MSTPENKQKTSTNGSAVDTGESEGNRNTMDVVSASGESTVSNNESEVTAMELFKENMQATITYCSVFWSFGMCVALLGPTLLDLGCLTSSPLEEMTWVFFAQALSTLVGSMLGGILIDRFHSDPLLLMSIITIAVTIALVPLCHLLWLLSIVLSVMGIAMGMIDTTANVCLIKIYGPQVSPFLQALHFCYGIGAFISPIVAEPFLLNEDCTPLLSYNQSVDTDKIARDITSPSVTDQTFTTMETLIEAQERTEVRFAFWIMALIQIPVVCMVLALLIKKRCFNSAKPKRKYEDIDKVSEATSLKAKAASKTNCCGSSSSTVIAITCLTALILFIYDGLQAAYGGYVYTYSVKSVIDLSSTEGAYLTSVYWGSFALGRLVSIPISTKVSPACMLFVNVIGCFASYVMELFFRHNNIAMYVGSATFGLFLSSIYPTALAWAESFINVTGPVTSVIVIGAATGEMLFPVIVGRIFVLLGPISFLVFGNIACFISLFVYIALYFIGRRTSKSKASSLSLTWCRACCCFASRESLLGKEVSYYTRFNEDIDAIKLVPVNEQVPPQKTKEIH